jgi:archaellum component FlaC
VSSDHHGYNIDNKEDPMPKWNAVQTFSNLHCARRLSNSLTNMSSALCTTNKRAAAPFRSNGNRYRAFQCARFAAATPFVRSRQTVTTAALGDVMPSLASLAVGAAMGAGYMFSRGQSGTSVAAPSAPAGPDPAVLAGQLSEAQSELDSKTKALERAETAAANASKLQATISAKQNEVAQLKQERSKLDRELEQLKGEAQSARELAAAAKEQIAGLESRIEALSAQLTTASNGLNNVKAAAAKQLGQLNGALAAAQNAAKQAQQDMQKAEAGSVRARTEMAAAVAASSKLQSEVSVLRRQV